MGKSYENNVCEIGEKTNMLFFDNPWNRPKSKITDVSRGLVPKFEGPTYLQAYIFGGFSKSKTAPCPWELVSGCLDLAEMVVGFVLQLYIVPLI